MRRSLMASVRRRRPNATAAALATQHASLLRLALGSGIYVAGFVHAATLLIHRFG